MSHSSNFYRWSLQIKISPHLWEINFFKIILRPLGIDEQQLYFSLVERQKGGKDLQVTCRQSALISYHDHESILVKDGRAILKMSESRITFTILVVYFATSFDVQGHAHIIIYFTSQRRTNSHVSVSPLRVQHNSSAALKIASVRAQALLVTQAINTFSNEFHKRRSSITQH